MQPPHPLAASPATWLYLCGVLDVAVSERTWEKNLDFITCCTWYLEAPREQKMLMGHLPRVMYHQVY